MRAGRVLIPEVRFQLSFARFLSNSYFIPLFGIWVPTQILTHARTHTHTHTLSLSPSPSLFLSFSLPLSLSLTHTHRSTANHWDQNQHSEITKAFTSLEHYRGHSLRDMRSSNIDNKIYWPYIEAWYHEITAFHDMKHKLRLFWSQLWRWTNVFHRFSVQYLVVRSLKLKIFLAKNWLFLTDSG